MHGGGAKGQDAKTEAVSEGCLELSALKSRALESGRLSSQADAGQQAQLRSWTQPAYSLPCHRARRPARHQREPGRNVGRRHLCLGHGPTGAHAVLADHMEFCPKQDVSLVMQGSPLRAKLCTFGAIVRRNSTGPWRMASWAVAAA
jgi:hypothetical protein